MSLNINKITQRKQLAILIGVIVVGAAATAGFWPLVTAKSQAQLKQRRYQT